MYEPVKKGELSLNKLINMALIVDAKNTFGDELNGDVQYAIDFIKQAWLEDAGHIIKHSIRFMKILKTMIEEKGVTFNTKEQTAFGNIYSKAFEEEDIDKNQDNENNEESYRIITWSSIYEDKYIAKKFMIKNVKGGSMIKLNIPKDCLNAGKINSIGKC